MTIINRVAACGTACMALVLGVGNSAWAQSPQSTDRFVLGFGAAAVPTFQGSNETRVLPFPVVDVKFGPLFLNPADGAGMLVVDNEFLSLGASVALVGGYRRRDVPQGIERIAFAPGARIFSKVRFGGFALGLGGTRALGGTDGIIVDATLAYPIPLSPRIVVTPAVGTTWANARYIDEYFGVNASEAAASGLPRFRGEAGFKDVGASLNGVFAMTNRISLTATVGLTRVLGDAADSPINERDWNASGFLGVAYRF